MHIIVWFRSILFHCEVSSELISIIEVNIHSLTSKIAKWLRLREHLTKNVVFMTNKIWTSYHLYHHDADGWHLQSWPLCSCPKLHTNPLLEYKCLLMSPLFMLSLDIPNSLLGTLRVYLVFYSHSFRVPSSHGSIYIMSHRLSHEGLCVIIKRQAARLIWRNAQTQAVFKARKTCLQLSSKSNPSPTPSSPWEK
jgi:hypothetical protein